MTFPHTATGKISKKDLRDRFQQVHAGGIERRCYAKLALAVLFLMVLCVGFWANDCPRYDRVQARVLE